jgi:hypothetical protein
MPLGAARFGLLGGVADLGKLELIETQTASADSSLIFSSIQESTYNVHFMTVNDYQPSTDDNRIKVRFFESGVEESASVYQTANQQNRAGGTISEIRSTGQDHIRFVTTTGSATNETGNGYMYFYNLGDSTKYSFTTMHTSTLTASPEFYMEFGSGVLPQANL